MLVDLLTFLATMNCESSCVAQEVVETLITKCPTVKLDEVTATSLKTNIHADQDRFIVLADVTAQWPQIEGEAKRLKKRVSNPCSHNLTTDSTPDSTTSEIRVPLARTPTSNIRLGRSLAQKLLQLADRSHGFYFYLTRPGPDETWQVLVTVVQ